MKRALLAALPVTLAAVLVPSFAAADPGSAVEADLTQLSTDLKAAHETAAQANRGLIKEIRQARRDARKAIRSLRRSKS